MLKVCPQLGEPGSKRKLPATRLMVLLGVAVTGTGVGAGGGGGLTRGTPLKLPVTSTTLGAIQPCTPLGITIRYQPVPKLLTPIIWTVVPAGKLPIVSYIVPSPRRTLAFSRAVACGVLLKAVGVGIKVGSPPAVGM